MKTKLLLILLSLGTLTGMYAQAGFNYKALITQNGSVLANQNIQLRFSVLENGSTVVYQEEQSATTDANGIVTAYIGEGTPGSGSFSGIDWSQPQYLKVEIDTGGGYQDFGTEELKPVPLAKYADKAGEVDYENINNAPVYFYVVNTTDLPASISDDIYHTGRMGIGSVSLAGNAMLTVTDGGSGPSTTNLGISTTLSNTTASNICLSNTLFGVSNNSQYGVKTINSNSGDGAHYGTYNYLMGSGGGNHVGTYNSLTNGTGLQMAVYNQIQNDGPSGVYGVINNLSGTSGGYAIGLRNNVGLSGNGNQIGVYNNMSGTGTGTKYGNYTSISSGSNGVKYGTYNLVSGSNSDNKYGTYDTIPSSAGGTHYAVYAVATKSGSYAGYFVGDVYAGQKLLSDDSGDADLKAYIYGRVSTSGGVSTSSSSAGFTVSKTGTGTYRVSFDHSPGSSSAYLVVASLTASIGFVKIMYSSNYFRVLTYDSSGSLSDMAFGFVVYKK